MRNNKFKKALSLLLCVLMLTGTMPVSVFAAEESAGEPAPAEEPGGCTCETDDPVWHAPFCALFVRSEGASCTCAEACSEELANDFCEVCYFEGIAACTGAAGAAAVYGVSVSNGVLTVSGELTPADYAVIHENLGRIDELVIENGVLDLSGHSTIADVTNKGTLAGGSFSGTVTNDGLITGGSYTFDIVNNGSITGGSFSGNLGNYGSISGSTAVSGELYNMPNGSISGLYYTGTLFDQNGSGTVEVYHKVNGADVLLPYGAPALALLSGGEAGVKFYVGDTALTGEETIPVTYTTYVGEYPISLRQIGSNGSVALDKTSARAGETVTLSAEIDEGYELSLSGADFTEAEGGYSFTMPAATVSVVAKIKPVGGYTVNVAQCIGGDINPDKGGALAGETVSFTATPATGYALESVSVLRGAKTVEVTENADSSYSFAMPEGDATLSAVFKQLSYNIGIADEYAGVTNLEAVEGKWSAVYGQTVTIGFHKPHYIPVSVTVTGTDGTVVSGTLSGGSYSFTMPASDVTVSVEYEAIKYNVDRQASSKYGEVQLSAYSAAYGDTVTVTALPGAGWKITPQVSVQGGEALELIAVEGEENTYSFTMPAAAVYVAYEHESISDATAGNLTVALKAGSFTYDRDARGKNFFFRLDVLDAQGGSAGSQTVSCSVGESRSFDGLPLGGSYTLSLINAENYETAEAAGTIAADSQAELAISRKTAELALKFSFSSRKEGETVSETSATVKISGGFSGSFGGVDFNSGSAAVTLKNYASDDDLLIISGLPAGEKVSFTLPYDSKTHEIQCSDIVLQPGANSHSVSVSHVGYTLSSSELNERSYHTKVTFPNGTRFLPGETATLQMECDEGYYAWLGVQSLQQADGSSFADNSTVQELGNGLWSFTMPEFDVSVLVVYAGYTHTITVENDDSKGTFWFEANTVGEENGTRVCQHGHPVILQAAPAEGWRFDGIEVYKGSEKVNTRNFTGHSEGFTMPNGDVKITVKWAKVYTITTQASPAEGGSLTVRPTSAAEGDTVTLTAAPEAYYRLSGFSFYDVSGESPQPLAVETTPVEGNEQRFTFTMPARNISVEAGFELPSGEGWYVGSYGGSTLYSLVITGKLSALPQGISHAGIVVDSAGELALPDSVTVTDEVHNYGLVSGGVYSSNVYNEGGTISGGSYSGTVYNDGLINGARFLAEASLENISADSVYVLHRIDGVDYALPYGGNLYASVNNALHEATGDFALYLCLSGSFEPVDGEDFVPLVCTDYINAGAVSCEAEFSQISASVNGRTYSSGEDNMVYFPVCAGETASVTITPAANCSVDKLYLNGEETPFTTSGGSVVVSLTMPEEECFFDIITKIALPSGDGWRLSVEGGLALELSKSVTQLPETGMDYGVIRVLEGVELDLGSAVTDKDVDNYGSISSGTYTGYVHNEGSISGGNYSGDVDNASGSISGGVFSGRVRNSSGIVSGGSFYGAFAHQTSGELTATITGGKFYGDFTTSADDTEAIPIRNAYFGPDASFSGAYDVFTVLHSVNGKDVALNYGETVANALGGGSWFIGERQLSADDFIGLHYSAYVGVYSIAADKDAADIITLSADTAHYGDTVTFTVTLPGGCELESITVSGESGQGALAVPVEGAENTYAFTMPADNVTVSASFTFNCHVEDGDLHVTGILRALPDDVEYNYIYVERSGNLALPDTVAVGLMVTNYGVISGGSYSKQIYNFGSISGGSYSGHVNNYDGGVISGGNCSNYVYNLGSISGGSHDGKIDNHGSISGGVYSDDVNSYGTISDGSYSGLVTNSGVISGGSYSYNVSNSGSISGGSYSYNVSNGGETEAVRLFGSYSQYGSGSLTSVYHSVNGVDTLFDCSKTLLENLGEGTWYDAAGNEITDETATVPYIYTDYHGPASYSITVADNISNGSVTASVSVAAAGETVRLTAIPNRYYVLESYTVTGTSGETVTVTDGSFTMPDEAVTVTARLELPSGEGWYVGRYDGFEDYYLVITGKVSALPQGITYDGIIVDSDGELALPDSVSVTKEVVNFGTISGGSYSGYVKNYAGGVISGGSYSKQIYNFGSISGGSHSGNVQSYAGGVISGGSFFGEVSNEAGSTISGGSFFGKFYSRGNVSGVKLTGTPLIFGSLASVYHSVNGVDTLLDRSKTLLENLGEGTWYDAEGNEITEEDKVVPIYTSYRSADYAPTYSISLSEVENGSLSVDKESAAAGDTVTITVSGNTGYAAEKVSVRTAVSALTLTVDVEGRCSFTMPAADVTVSAEFAPIDYTVTYESSGSGDVSVDLPTAHYGDTVIIELRPGSHYAVDTFKVNKKSGGGISLRPVEGVENAYTFTMPAEDVIIQVVFAPETYTLTVAEDGGAALDDSVTAPVPTYGQDLVIRLKNAASEKRSDVKIERIVVGATGYDQGVNNGITVSGNTVTIPARLVTGDVLVDATAGVEVVVDLDGGSISPGINIFALDESGKAVSSGDAYLYDFMIGLEACFEKTGYRLHSWIDGEGSERNDEFYAPNGDEEISLVWEAKEYDVVWYNGSEVFAENTQLYDAKLTLPENQPARTGYRFTGWFTAEEGGDPLSRETVYRTADNSRFYAQFVECDHAGNTNPLENLGENHSGTCSVCAETFVADHDHSGGKACACGRKITPVVSVTAVEGLVYDGSALTLVSASNSGGGLLFSMDNGAGWSEELPTATAAGEYEILYKVPGNEDYEAVAEESVKVTIGPRAADNVTVSLDESSFVYDGTEKKPGLTVTDGDVALVCDEDYTVGYRNFVNAGEATVELSFIGNYSGTVTESYTITAREVTAPEFVGLAAYYLHTGAPIEPAFTLKDDLGKLIPAGEYSVSYSGNTALGEATITVSDVRGGNYIVSGSTTFRIVEHEHNWSFSASGDTITANCSGEIGTCPDAEQTLTVIAPEDSVYSGNPCAGAEVTGGIDGVNYTLRYTGTGYDSADAPTNAGNYTVTLTAGGVSAAASFTISPKPISNCAVSLIQNAFHYSGKVPELKVSAVDNGVGRYTMQQGIDYTVEPGTGVDVGSYSAVVRGTGNYTGSVMLGYMIEARMILISNAVVKPQSYSESGYDLEVTEVTFDNVVEGETVAYLANARLTGPNAVGTQSVEVTVLCGDENYYLYEASFTGTVTINPADAIVTAAPTANSLRYTGLPLSLISPGTAEGGTMVYSLTEDGAFSETIPTGTAAGDYVVYYKINADENHSDTAVQSVPVTIGKAPLTVTANDSGIIYGASPADNGVSYSGFVNGETEAVLEGSVTYDYGYEQLGAVGDYAITPGGLRSDNYEIAFVDGTLTVAPKAIPLKADAVSKVYGSADPELTYKFTGLEEGDSLSGALSRAEGENVGTYAIEQGSLTAGANYDIIYIGADLTVTPKELVITADAVSKAYGSADPALTYKVEGLVEGDTLSGKLSRAEGENVGTYAIEQGSLTAGENYAITYTGANLTITAKPITVKADAVSKVYGSADPALTCKVEGLVGNDSLTGELSRAEGENVGTYAIAQGTLTAGENYAITYTGANLTIAAKGITVKADAVSKVYGSADPALTYKVEGLVGNDSLSGALSRTEGENAGTYAIEQGSLTAGDNYAVTYTGANLTIAAKGITVKADAVSKVYGSADPELTYKVEGLVNGDSLSGALSRAEGENVGTYAIAQGTLTAGDNYTITYTGADLTVNAKPITVTADAVSKVYGSADPELTYKVEGLVNGDSLSGALIRAEGENVGTYAIAQGTLTAGDNYAVTYTGANLTVTAKPITITADAVSKVYGSADPALTYKVEGLVGNDSLSGALSRAEGENVGTYAIEQGSLTAGENYAIRYTGAKLTIAAKGITVKADAVSKVYGSADPALTYKVVGLVGNDSLSGALSRAEGENVGTYAIAQGSLTAGENYAITYTGANLTITAKPITVKADAVSKVYGSADPELTYKVEGLVTGDALSGKLSRTAGENVGTYAIEQGTLTAGDNYTITYTGADLTITAKPITVTADAVSKVYGSADPALTYKVEGLVEGDTLSGALSRAEGENVGTYAIAQGTLTAGENYAVTYTGANLTVTAKPITITADAVSKVYGSADPALTYKVVGLVGNDSLSGALSRAEGENVGTYAIEQGSLTAGENYAISYTGANLTIAAKGITVKADAVSKVYGSADPALTYKVVGLVGNDSLSGTLSRAVGENVGTYAIAQGSLTAGENYAITYTGANLTITAKPITVKADAVSKVYGSADPELTYKVEGLVTGDALSGKLSRTAGENVGTYAIAQGTLTAGDNYTITYTGANLTINPRPIGTWDVALKGSLYYNGSEQTQGITVTRGVTYFVRGNKGTAVGNYELSVTGTGNYCGTVTVEWKIEAPAIIDDVVSGKIDPDNVNQDQREELENLKEALDSVKDESKLDDEDKEILNKAEAALPGILDALEELDELVESENIAASEDITAENVKPQDEEKLAEAKAEIEKLLTDKADQLGQEEKKALEKKLEEIDQAITLLGGANTLIEEIRKWHGDNEGSFDADSLALREEFESFESRIDALSENGAAIVREHVGEELKNAEAKLYTYRIISGDEEKWTKGNSKTLDFTANGHISLFSHLLIDGERLDEEHYSLEEGSTIVQLNTEYLRKLSPGEHSIQFVYTDGMTDEGTFRVLRPSLYLGIAAAAAGCLALVGRRKRKEKETV